MKTTKYTNKELVEIYKNLKTSAKILGFSSASDSEMIAEIELEAIKRHLNLIDGTVEETAELETETNETTVETTADMKKMFRYDVDLHFSWGWDTYEVNAECVDKARYTAIMRVINEISREYAEQIDCIRVYKHGTDKLFEEYSIA